jgi:hypothetical protein
MAAESTYTPLATTTLGSAAASVTFSSISGAYTDLVVIFAGTGGGVDIQYQFNADTGTNYSVTRLSGNGSTAVSNRNTGYASIEADYNAYANATQTVNICNIMNYSNSTTYKTVLFRSNNASLGVDAGVGLWRNTAAITQVLIKTNSGTFSTGTVFSLYGIAAA